MSFKLIKRSQAVIFISLHAAILPLMVYLVDCVIDGAGILSAPLLFTFIQKYNLVFLTAAVAAFLVFTGKKYALVTLVLHNALITFILFSLYYTTNSKIAFFYSSINVIFSIMFVSLWIEESQQAVYKPGYLISRLGEVGNKNLPIRLFPDWGEGLSGKLTSWSNSTFFLILDQNVLKVAPDAVDFEIDFENQVFKGKGDVVSSYGKGLGISVNMEENETLPFHWKDLYTIIIDRGF